MTQTPPSVRRILWDGFRKQQAMSPLLLVASAFLWIAGIAAYAVGFVDTEAGLEHLAFPLMNLSWFTGFGLTQLALVIGSRSKWQSDALGEHHRSQLKRWMKSSGPTYVDLSGNAKQRAELTAAAKEAANQPDITIIAIPLLTALGAAFMGFAGAMVLAEAYVSPRSLVLDDPGRHSLYWGGLLLLFLWMSLWSVGRASLRVYRWAGQRAAEAAQARADAERAQLSALQSQMNPHFLFNTLNTVAALAGPDSRQAEEVVEHLSAVLRQSLQRANQPFTSVEDEVRFITEYLGVEQARLGSMLRITWNIARETLPLRVPTMCLLPLVENAISYAVEARPDGGHLQISAGRSAGGYLLRLSVEDDGPGFPPDMKDGKGLGDLRERLRAEYSRKQELDTETLPTGARAVISVPAVGFVALPS